MKEKKISGREGLGKFVMVDDDIYEKIRYKELKLKSGKERNPYVYWTETGADGKYKHVRLHRYVYGDAKPNEMVDHIDTNPLNCQRDNLRVATREENNRNRKSFKNSTSIYKGVAYDKQKKKWRAQIAVDKKLYFLGYFDDAVLAAETYDMNAINLHKEFALLNFPEKNYQDYKAKKIIRIES